MTLKNVCGTLRWSRIRLLGEGVFMYTSWLHGILYESKKTQFF